MKTVASRVFNTFDDHPEVKEKLQGRTATLLLAKFHKPHSLQYTKCTIGFMLYTWNTTYKSTIIVHHALFEDGVL